jgi:hypothetical protein
VGLALVVVGVLAEQDDPDLLERGQLEGLEHVVLGRKTVRLALLGDELVRSLK